MTKAILFGAIVAMFGVLVVSPAQAHEHAMYRIGGQTYTITVGSVNEPIAVDDRTGVFLEVMQGEHGGGTPVLALEETLQVEVSAGSKSRVMSFSPIAGSEGAYQAAFIPTVATTYTYRLFGEINNTPVDLSFTCNPAGHPVSEAQTEPAELSEGVTQMERSGAFGCPLEKDSLGFPEPSADIVSVQQGASEAGDASSSARNLGIAGIAFGLIGSATGAMALRRRS